MVSKTTGFFVQPNKAIVGKNAFAHESGIHQDGMLKHSNTYEIMTPESIGLSSSELVLGKHSGRHAFKVKLEELGVKIKEKELDKLFKKFKDLADKKKQLFEEDLIALVDESSTNSKIKFIDLKVKCGSNLNANSEIQVEIDGKLKKSISDGQGQLTQYLNQFKKLLLIMLS